MPASRAPRARARRPPAGRGSRRRARSSGRRGPSPRARPPSTNGTSRVAQGGGRGLRIASSSSSKLGVRVGHGGSGYPSSPARESLLDRHGRGRSEDPDRRRRRRPRSASRSASTSRHAFAALDGGRRPRAARRRPDDARRARAGGGARRRVPRRSTSRSSPCSATTTSTQARGDEVVRGARGRRRPRARARVGDRTRWTALEVGIVGAKGFVGGFPGAVAAGLRRAAAARRCTRRRREEVDGDRARAAGDRATADLRIVLLHYAPIPRDARRASRRRSTRSSARRGSRSRSREHQPDLVLHGHAHRGTFEGELGPVPVRNVAVAVTGKDFGSSSSEARRS